MKKLRLNVDDLRVSSFDTSAMNGKPRTVVAYDAESDECPPPTVGCPTAGCSEDCFPTDGGCPPFSWTQDEFGSRCCHTWFLDSRCADSLMSYCDC